MEAERLVVIGHPVAHSLSPVFQAAALQAAGIDATYEAVDVAPADLPAMIARIRAERLLGNVTVPHKEAFHSHCDIIWDVAKRVGAVNCFWCDSAGQLHGENTDVGGFDAAARRVLAHLPAHALDLLPSPTGQTVALLGAGGAAAAVCEAVSAWPGARVRIHARTAARAKKLAARYAATAEVVPSVEDAVRGATLVVNATPVGLHDDALPVVPEALENGAAVLDLVYRRQRTPWVQACRSRGLRAHDGLGMLLEQGALSFERWFGLVPDREAMWESVIG
ncbi:MAG: shikimate dehydrogenase [Gemmatimonadaceae bacterium]|nr:shikimate dehydrogenase [Gemmatimonadaceae bacterium]